MSVFIMTKIYDANCMNHEQNRITAGVYTDAEKAKDASFDWLNKKSQAVHSSHQDILDRNHKRCIYIESECGNYAASVMEHDLIT